MIRKNRIDCKLIVCKKLKSSGFAIVSGVLDDIRLSDEVCPSCGCRGGCSPHGSYRRWLTDFEDGKVISRRITIPRVICTCGATHAILPDPIIPYKQYSLFFILLVLALHLGHLMTLEKICEKYMITPGMLYRWLEIYSDHRREWQGLLKSISTDLKHSLLELARKDPFSTFAVTFVSTTTMSFLQSHANPANCRRNLQYAYFSRPLHTTWQ